MSAITVVLLLHQSQVFTLTNAHTSLECR